MERTLIIFKPDAVMRGIVGEVLSRFEKVGLKIVGAKMLQPDYDHYYQHYEGIGTLKTRKGNEILRVSLRTCNTRSCRCRGARGGRRGETVRKMVGSTEPKSALPGTIRGDYAHVSYAQANESGKSVSNVIHASAEVGEAEQEIAHWFSDSELLAMKLFIEHFTQPKRANNRDKTE